MTDSNNDKNFKDSIKDKLNGSSDNSDDEGVLDKIKGIVNKNDSDNESTQSPSEESENDIDNNDSEDFSHPLEDNSTDEENNDLDSPIEDNNDTKLNDVEENTVDNESILNEKNAPLNNEDMIDSEPASDEEINELNEIAGKDENYGEYDDSDYASPQEESWGDGYTTTDAEGRTIEPDGNVIFGDGAGEPNPIQSIPKNDIPDVEGDRYMGSDNYASDYGNMSPLYSDEDDNKNKGMFASVGAWAVIGALGLLTLGSLGYSLFMSHQNDELNNKADTVVTRTQQAPASTDTVKETAKDTEQEKAHSSALQAKDRRIEELKGQLSTAENSAKDAQQKNRGLESQVSKIRGQKADTITKTSTLPPRVSNHTETKTETRDAETKTETKTVTEEAPMRTITTTIHSRG